MMSPGLSPALSMDELLTWNEEASSFWKAHLDANPALLELPCGIGGAATVNDFVRHIWAVELRWAHRLAGEPEQPRDAIPTGPLDALHDLHKQAVRILRRMIDNPAEDWEAIYTLQASWIPPDKRSMSRRKVLAHALLHSQRHWAQLATLVRNAGFPSEFRGDLLFSSALR
jgi:uncharacterized damage-inducible protein DinB